MSTLNSFDDLDKEIIACKQDIINAVKTNILKVQNEQGLDDYKIGWKLLQETAIPAIKKILSQKLPEAKFEISKSKSTYPDLKMTYGSFTIAIDIKSNEEEKDPWYDIARLDTIEKKRLSVFDEEYDLVVKYSSENKSLKDVYFEPMRHTVGKGPSGGVKYRPYDGKLRPKTWEEFGNGKIHWEKKEDFQKGIIMSQKSRWYDLIQECLIPILDKKEKEKFRKLFD